MLPSFIDVKWSMLRAINTIQPLMKQDMRARADVSASWQRPPIGPYSGRSLLVLWTRSWTSQTIQPFETAATTSQSHWPAAFAGRRKTSKPRDAQATGICREPEIIWSISAQSSEIVTCSNKSNRFQQFPTYSYQHLLAIYIYTYIINARCATVTLVIIWCREGRVPMRRGEQLAAVAEAHSSEFQCSWRLTAHETLQSTWRCNAAARSLKVHG